MLEHSKDSLTAYPQIYFPFDVGSAEQKGSYRMDTTEVRSVPVKDILSHVNTTTVLEAITP